MGVRENLGGLADDLALKTRVAPECRSTEGILRVVVELAKDLMRCDVAPWEEWLDRAQKDKLAGHAYVVAEKLMNYVMPERMGIALARDLEDVLGTSTSQTMQAHAALALAQVYLQTGLAKEAVRPFVRACVSADQLSDPLQNLVTIMKDVYLPPIVDLMDASNGVQQKVELAVGIYGLPWAPTDLKHRAAKVVAFGMWVANEEKQLEKWQAVVRAKEPDFDLLPSPKTEEDEKPLEPELIEPSAEVVEVIVPVKGIAPKRPDPRQTPWNERHRREHHHNRNTPEAERIKRILSWTREKRAEKERLAAEEARRAKEELAARAREMAARTQELEGYIRHAGVRAFREMAGTLESVENPRFAKALSLVAAPEGFIETSKPEEVLSVDAAVAS